MDKFKEICEAYEILMANFDEIEDKKHIIVTFGKSSDADIKIVTGLVEPHFMAGYSGGRKVVAPGVAHHTTIRTFHSARFMENSYATSCNLVKNPLHEEQLEIMIDNITDPP